MRTNLKALVIRQTFKGTKVPLAANRIFVKEGMWRFGFGVRRNKRRSGSKKYSPFDFSPASSMSKSASNPGTNQNQL